MLGNPLVGFEVQRSAIVNFSREMRRPECILAALGTVAPWMANINFGGAGRPMLHGHESQQPPNPL